MPNRVIDIALPVSSRNSSHRPLAITPSFLVIWTTASQLTSTSMSHAGGSSCLRLAACSLKRSPRQASIGQGPNALTERHKSS
jgi:hypothetical protein